MATCTATAGTSTKQRYTLVIYAAGTTYLASGSRCFFRPPRLESVG